MDDKERNRFADALLEAALRRYRSEAPRPGLEARILAQVQAREREARPHGWAWALGATAAALAIGAVTIYLPQHHPVVLPSTPRATTARSESQEQEKVAVVTRPSSTPPLRARRTRAVTIQPSRPAQFPTPAPLTEQEKLLLLYVKQTPASVLGARVNRPLDEDVEIPDLNIAALEFRPLGESEETKGE
jgi:hypothetical protein